MQIKSRAWTVALVCLLVCSISHVSGLPSDMQSDDWSASTILTNAVNEYVKPYTEPLVDRVVNSTAWNLFGRALNKVQGAINLTGGLLHTYYEDHVKDSVDNTKEWIENKTKPIVERLRDKFKQAEASQAK